MRAQRQAPNSIRHQTRHIPTPRARTVLLHHVSRSRRTRRLSTASSTRTSPTCTSRCTGRGTVTYPRATRSSRFRSRAVPTTTSLWRLQTARRDTMMCCGIRRRAVTLRSASGQVVLFGTMTLRECLLRVIVLGVVRFTFCPKLAKNDLV